MNPKILIGATILAGGLLASCGGGDDNGATGSGSTTTTGSTGSTTPPVTSQVVDTAQVLATARETSEMGEPFTVDGGAFSFNDTSETTDPIAVNGS
jgi:hypothetical protein